MASSSSKGKKKAVIDLTSNRAITEYFIVPSSSPCGPGPSRVQSQPSRSRSFARTPSASTFAALAPAALNGAPPLRVRPKAGPARMPSSPPSMSNLPAHLQKKFPRNSSSGGSSGVKKVEAIDLTRIPTPPPPPAQKGDRGRSPITVSSNTSRAESLKRSHYSISSDHSSDVVALDSPPQQPPAKRMKVKVEGRRQVSAAGGQPAIRVPAARVNPGAPAVRANAGMARSATAPNLLLPAAATSSDESDRDGVPFTPKVRRVHPKPQAQAKPRMPLSANNSTVLPPSQNSSNSGAVVKVKEFSPSQLQNLSPAKLSQRRPPSSAGKSRHIHGHSPSKTPAQDLPSFNHDIDFNFAGDDGPSFMEVDDPIPPVADTKTQPPTPDSSRKTVTPTARAIPRKTPVYRTPPHLSLSMPRAKSVASPRTPSSLGPQSTSSLPQMLRGVGATPPSSPPPSARSPLAEDLPRSVSRRLSKTPSRRLTSTSHRRSMSLTPGERIRRELAAAIGSDDSDSDVDYEQVMRELNETHSFEEFKQDSDGASTEVVSDSEPEDVIPRAQLAARRPAVLHTGSSKLRESTPMQPQAVLSPLSPLSPATAARLRATRESRSPSIPRPNEPSRLVVMLPTSTSAARVGLKRDPTSTTKLHQPKLPFRAQPKKNAEQIAGEAFFDRIGDLIKSRDDKLASEAAADKIAEEARKEARRRAERERKKQEAVLLGLPVEPDSEEADAEDSDDEGGMGNGKKREKRLDEDARKHLDDEARETYDAIWEAGAGGEKEGLCERVGYFPFWEQQIREAVDGSVPMELADELPSSPSTKGLRPHQLSALAAAVKDIPSLVWWLNVDVPPSTPAVLSWLLELAFFPGNADISAAAFDRAHQLLQCGSDAGNLTIPLSLSAALKPLIRLGAAREAVDLVVPGTFDEIQEPNYAVAPARRDALACDWVAMMRTAVSTGCVATTDMPNLLLVVLLVAMDKHSTDATLVEAVQTVEAVVRSCDDDIEREANLCGAISAWAMLAAVPVRARLLQLVSSGRSATRLTRWLAFSFLTDRDLSDITPETYSQPPPLNDLVPILMHSKQRLSSNGDAPRPTPFRLNAETDFIALGHHAEILSWALTSIHDYITSVKLVEQTDFVTLLLELERLMSRIQKRGGGVKGGNVDATSAQEALRRVQMRVRVEIDRLMKHATKAPRDILRYLENDVGIKHTDSDTDS